MAPNIPFFVFVVLSQLLLLNSADDDGNRRRGDCLSFPCGELVLAAGVQVQLEHGGRWYEVDKISQGDTLTIYDEILATQLNQRDCQSLNNLSLPNLPYVSFEIVPNLTLCKCETSSNISLPNETELRHTPCDNYAIYYHRPKPPPNDDMNQDDRLSSLCPCPTIQLPLSEPPSDNGNVFDLLTPNVSVEVYISGLCSTCYRRGGICLARNQNFYCGKGMTKSGEKLALGMNKSGVKLALGLIVGAISLLISCSIALYFRRRIWCISMFRKSDTDLETFIRNNGTSSPKRYSYLDIKKMTDSFKEKLGKGGFGSVYKGKAPDGHFVAVKVLNTTKGDGQDFVNEDRRHLTSGELFNAAIGTARGLEYLHSGCNTRILHFDIKPHNILLDENFLPKIADFGLAKLCTTKESIVSMLEARGTIGYIAPEVFCRNVGGVSHKSDVYNDDSGDGRRKKEHRCRSRPNQ
ncbi:hypothetical protein V6N11_033586 [Hibiscus sabdariffa]|uniref:Protein kinase domain-containing protein n=1 Tax=Hibiscus sabdariffa TaxID=183260 RepID=A0ABR2PYI8_9ROSI